MLMEAIEYIRDLAVDSADAKKARVLTDIPGNGTVAVIQHDGELIDRPIPPKLRAHAVDSVRDMIDAARRWKGETGNVIWISADKVVLVIDDADRRETVTLPLVESYVFRRIKQLASNPVLDQTALVRLLRVELRGLVNAAAILTAVRKIKFRQSQAGHSDIQHGNESLGRTIEAEVTGAESIPDSLIVETNLFSNPGLDEMKSVIGLDLEIDVKNQKFLLRPIPDEVEKVTAVHLNGIRDEIENSDLVTEVFFGRP